VLAGATAQSASSVSAGTAAQSASSVLADTAAQSASSVLADSGPATVAVEPLSQTRPAGTQTAASARRVGSGTAGTSGGNATTGMSLEAFEALLGD
jgi:hypothetical protein